jgi:hypothetical protein
MEGAPVHVWASLHGQPPESALMPEAFWGWTDVTVDEEGALYAVVRGESVLKLDRDSRVAWAAPLSAHHEVHLAADGGVYTLTNELRVRELAGRRWLVLDNDVVRLDRAGRVTGRTSLLDVLLADPALAPLVAQRVRARQAAIERLGLRGAVQRWSDAPETAAIARRLLASPWLAQLERALAGAPAPRAERGLLALLEHLPGSPFDVLHGNAARPLARAVPGLGAAGDVLVSLRDLDLVLVVDTRGRRVRWRSGDGALERQHDPWVLASGHLLLFDNRPSAAESRVIEVTPSGRIVWSRGGFFSATGGSCQALANGNVLVAETQGGRALELTRTGEVVWEFVTPEEAGGRRPVLRHLTRLGGEASARLRRTLVR